MSKFTVRPGRPKPGFPRPRHDDVRHPTVRMDGAPSAKPFAGMKCRGDNPVRLEGVAAVAASQRLIRPFYKLVRRRVIRHLYARLAEFERQHVRPNALRLPLTARDLLRAQVASYLGHLRHAHSYRLWLHTLERFPWLSWIFDQPENAVGAQYVGAASAATCTSLRPAWEPAAVSGLAGQYRAFVRRYPDACVLMQVGKNWLAAGGQAAPLALLSGAVTARRPGFGHCIELSAYRLAQARQKLKRAAIPHVLVAQSGHFKTGFKRRAMMLIWRPTPDPIKPFLSSSRRGPT